MTPIFKNAEIKFEDIGEYMQNYHNENDIPFNKGKKLIGLDPPLLLRPQCGRRVGWATAGWRG